MDFMVPTLPADAVVTAASLIIANYETFEGPNVYEVDTYTAPSSIADPARANVRNFVTSFQLQVNPNPFSLDVTSAVLTDLSASPHYSDIGFSIRQIADNSGYDCSARLGESVYEVPELSITYEIQPTPPTTAVPEPSAWAMLFAGVGTVGAAVRSRRRSTSGVA
jgi:hypothetical protein